MSMELWTDLPQMGCPYTTLCGIFWSLSHYTCTRLGSANLTFTGVMGYRCKGWNFLLLSQTPQYVNNMECRRINTENFTTWHCSLSKRRLAPESMSESVFTNVVNVLCASYSIYAVAYSIGLLLTLIVLAHYMLKYPLKWHSRCTLHGISQQSVMIEPCFNFLSGYWTLLDL